MGSGVDAMKEFGSKVSVYDYSRYVWDNDPMVRATWSQGAKGEKFDSFDDFNNWLKEASPENYVD